MEFDKTKIYTAVNADEVKVGSIGFFGNTVAELKCKFNNDEFLHNVVEILEDECNFRFKDNNNTAHSLFYLANEPKETEPKYRPYKDIKEMFLDRLGENYDELTKAAIARLIMCSREFRIKSKIINVYRMIDGVNLESNSVLIAGAWYTMKDLFGNDIEWDDGSVCGVEED